MKTLTKKYKWLVLALSVAAIRSLTLEAQEQPYTFTTIAGNLPRGALDGLSATSRLFNPTSVAVDQSNNVYVADFQNNTIRKITPGRVVSTIAGLAGIAGSADGTAHSARFSTPSGIAADNAGNLFVADFGNHTIRKITPEGEVSTF